MERIISQEERIRRAEEIYNRRRYEDRNTYYARNKNRQDEDISSSIKIKLRLRRSPCMATLSILLPTALTSSLSTVR